MDSVLISNSQANAQPLATLYLYFSIDYTADVTNQIENNIVYKKG